MTIAAKTADLTKAINDTVKELQVTQASLDAQVSIAEAYATTAATHQATAEGYRDTAATHATTAATSLATVQANVTYEGIEAILAEKAVTAVDVFVYDTSLDSDGGAWRKRTQHTSWYNETLNTATRGSRREFPAVAVIVAESNGKVTIYDGDDLSLPMWMVVTWNINPYVFALYAKNGIVAVGNNYVPNAAYGGNGLALWDFAKGVLRRSLLNTSGNGWFKFYEGFTSTVKVADGPVNTTVSTDPSRREFQLVNFQVNDVAMTVLPDAPIDPATLLQVPTIAVATGGGVSVIQHDGTVTNDSTLNWNFNNTFIQISGETLATVSGSNHFYLGDIRDGQFVHEIEGTIPGGKLSQAVGGRSWVANPLGLFERDNFYVGHYNGMITWTGLTDSKHNPMGRAMVRHTERTFVTGWHLYDTVGSFLADADDTNLVGGELVTNGTFDTDTSGWTVSAGLSATVSSGQVTLTNDTGFTAYSENIYQDLSGLVVGKTYVLSLDYVSGTNRVRFTWSTPFTQQYSNNSTSVTFVATSASGRITIFLDAINLGENATIDNISLRQADADRSVYNKPLIANGTITRSPVADGAELVGYSGFSAANYLEQPYNSALDFGTGDFCVMGWANLSAISGTQPVVTTARYGGSSWATSGVYVRFSPTGLLSLIISDDSFATNDVAETPWQIGSWSQFCAVRSGSSIYMYKDGTLAQETPIVNSTSSLSTSEPLVVGRLAGSTSVLNYGSLALLRISKTAPTPDQIAKIYEDERKLFQPGAQCTLYGANNNVVALAHDPKTNLLHLGTPSGRSTFDGLVRVANTTTPVGTAISAVNGLIVEE
jgi:hypothetical protein